MGGRLWKVFEISVSLVMLPKQESYDADDHKKHFKVNRMSLKSFPLRHLSTFRGKKNSDRVQSYLRWGVDWSLGWRMSILHDALFSNKEAGVNISILNSKNKIGFLSSCNPCLQIRFSTQSHLWGKISKKFRENLIETNSMNITGLRFLSTNDNWLQGDRTYDLFSKRLAVSLTIRKEIQKNFDGKTFQLVENRKSDRKCW